MQIKGAIKKIGFIILLIYLIFSYISYINPSLEIVISISIYLLCAVVLTYTLINKRFYCNDYIKNYLLFFIVIMCSAVIPYIGTKYNIVVFDALINIFKILILTYCVYVFVEYDKLYVIYAIISISALGLFLFTGAQFDISSGERFGNELAGNANIIAPLYMFAAISSTYCFFRAKIRLYKVIYLCAYIIQLYAIILTGTKKSLIISFTFFWLFFILTQKRKFVFLSFIIFVSSAVLFISLIFNNPVLYDLIGYRFEGMLLALTTGQGDGSTMERMNMIQDAAKFWETHPIFGIGLNLFSVKGDYGAYSHNNYLELLSTTGLLGFITYYSYHIKTIYNLGRTLKSNRQDNIFGLLIIGSMLFYDIGAVSYNLPLVQIFLLLSCNQHNNLTSTVPDRVHMEHK